MWLCPGAKPLEVGSASAGARESRDVQPDRGGNQSFYNTLPPTLTYIDPPNPRFCYRQKKEGRVLRMRECARPRKLTYEKCIVL